jgi:hypothetical protein
MTLEQAILEKVRSLPIEKQQEILNFADSLAREFQADTLSGAENFLSFAHGQQLTLNKALKPLFCVVNQPYSQ